jgi:dihydrofolate reductase
MRRVRYQVTASLDGFIAGPKGEYDWIPHDPDVDFSAIWAQYDTLIMGRKTFETTLAAKHPAVTIVHDDPAAHVRRLKAQPGKDIWLFGGGRLFRTLLDAGVVDTVEPAVCPILLGGGIPLLPGSDTAAKLSLTGHKLYPKSGIMLLQYAVRR